MPINVNSVSKKMMHGESGKIEIFLENYFGYGTILILKIFCGLDLYGLVEEKIKTAEKSVEGDNFDEIYKIYKRLPPGKSALKLAEVAERSC